MKHNNETDNQLTYVIIRYPLYHSSTQQFFALDYGYKNTENETTFGSVGAENLLLIVSHTSSCKRAGSEGCKKCYLFVQTRSLMLIDFFAKYFPSIILATHTEYVINP